MITKVEVSFNSTIAHNSQLFAGLELLNKAGEINLTYRFAKGELPFHMVKVMVNGKKCVFDFADHSLIEKEQYEQSDCYVKRMLLKEDSDKFPKLIPYGLNYSVMTDNSFLKYIFLKEKSLLKYSVRYNRLFSKILGVTDSIMNVDVRHFWNAPLQNGKIAFRARLWNPANNETPWKKEERKVLNSERIEIIRKLKIAYPNEFIGGIEGDDFSQQACPDIVISKNASSKKAYLEVLKSSVIGIANQGLEGSIGWKLPEYVAHGMAVITTPISQYELHGKFEEGVNYLTFQDTESCLEAVATMVENPEKRMEMQLANADYYQKFLHPASKLREILRLVESY